MSVEAVLADLFAEMTQRGITITLTPTSLRYQGPPDAMTADLKARLVANKEMVRDRLQVRAQADALLTRIDSGDAEAVRAYAKLAEEQGWPSYDTRFASWEEWALDVRAWLLEQRVSDSEARITEMKLQGALL